MPASPYPVFLDLHRRPVLIVGGGQVALRKAQGLLATGARVVVVSPEFTPALAALQTIERIQAPYAATHMARKSWRLVFAATDRTEVNAQVQKHAEAAGIFCCRCDKPDDGDFSSGATRRIASSTSSAESQAGVVLAVSTSAASPALAARICQQAVDGIDPILITLAGLLAAWRANVKSQIAAGPARKALLQRIAGEEMESILRAGGETAAHEKFHQWLAEAAASSEPPPAISENSPTETPPTFARARHAGK